MFRINVKLYGLYNCNLYILNFLFRNRLATFIMTSFPHLIKFCFFCFIVPPTFIDSETSSEVLAREGSNVTLSCRVRGHPAPSISWRREDGQILMPNICSQHEDRCQNGKYLKTFKHILKLNAERNDECK